VKYYQFTLSSREAEAMWDFAQKNQVNIHFERKIDPVDEPDPMAAILKQKYTYGGYMSEETFLMFCLTVRVQDVR
jgi:hypothetical protein